MFYHIVVESLGCWWLIWGRQLRNARQGSAAPPHCPTLSLFGLGLPEYSETLRPVHGCTFVSQVYICIAFLLKISVSVVSRSPLAAPLDAEQWRTKLNERCVQTLQKRTSPNTLFAVHSQSDFDVQYVWLILRWPGTQHTRYTLLPSIFDAKL